MLIFSKSPGTLESNPSISEIFAVIVALYSERNASTLVLAFSFFSLSADNSVIFSAKAVSNCRFVAFNVAILEFFSSIIRLFSLLIVRISPSYLILFVATIAFCLVISASFSIRILSAVFCCSLNNNCCAVTSICCSMACC